MRYATAVFGLAASSLAITIAAIPAGAAEVEFLCTKPDTTAFDENTVIACYTDPGCGYVQKLGADPVRDYDVKSVAAALGREKIEGIVTSSASVIKQIKGYGYVCKEVKP